MADRDRDGRFADPARSDDRDEEVRQQLRHDRGDIAVPSDHPAQARGQAEASIAGPMHKPELLRYLRALDRSHETIASARCGRDIAGTQGTVVKRAPER